MLLGAVPIRHNRVQTVTIFGGDFD
ncbi:MAG: hypothetical protein RL299_1732, partial [Pseudomonadota bacterium]